jgi:hypothetical protein
MRRAMRLEIGFNWLRPVLTMDFLNRDVEASRVEVNLSLCLNTSA